MTRALLALMLFGAVATAATTFALVGWKARQRYHEHNHAACPLDGMIPRGVTAEIDTWQCDSVKCGAVIVIQRRTK